MTERAQNEVAQWKRGYPPGKYYEGMVDDFEVYFSPGGFVWHRRKQVPTLGEGVGEKEGER
jgi:hypothetical protein